ncbi:unnamed protein product, partial [Mesorhabditis belari]|uniref:Uncharacterized protein n=1 Tax=Mesorhabditis belari TaxID=2138241 RepID=A0AAF3J3W1_9BILA
MMFAEILFGAFIFGFASADCNANQQAAILQCYAPYLQYYGVNSQPGMLPDLQTLANAMQQKFDQLGQQAAKDLCDHATPLSQCLAKVMSPIDLDCFMQLTGNKTDDSYGYMEDIAVHNYECGAGYKVFVQEFYCMEGVQKNQATLLQQCQDDLNKNLQNGMPVCQAYDTYISCESVVLARYCDYNAGVFYCNVLRVALDSVYNVCDNQHQLTPCPDYH